MSNIIHYKQGEDPNEVMKRYQEGLRNAGPLAAAAMGQGIDPWKSLIGQYEQSAPKPEKPLDAALKYFRRLGLTDEEIRIAMTPGCFAALRDKHR